MQTGYGKIDVLYVDYFIVHLTLASEKVDVVYANMMR